MGDHSTPYNPPDPGTYPAGAKTYAIKRGDTLWALAKQFYGNAYLWPQLWESNTWITDAHWIYPGDVLLIEGETGTQTAAGPADTTALPVVTPSAGTDTTAQPSTALSAPSVMATLGAGRPPEALANPADLYCFGYLGDPHEQMPNYVSSFEDIDVTYEIGAVEQNLGVAEGEMVYIEGGTQTGIVAGETYLVVEPGELVLNPGTRKVIGRHNDFAGQIRILCAGDHQSRGIVTASCMDIHMGARLKPLPQFPIPIARIPDLPAICDPTDGRAHGFIVRGEGAEGGRLTTLGEGSLLEINIGHDDALAPGDFLNVLRDSPIAGQPRQILGEIAVLTTEAHTATARVVLMRRSMQVGDHVEAK